MRPLARPHCVLAIALFIVALSLSQSAAAQTAAGTLSYTAPGSLLDVRVVRDGRRLPIFRVPYLRAGDRLSVNSPSAGADYIIAVAFIRADGGVAGQVEGCDPRAGCEYPIPPETAPLVFIAPKIADNWLARITRAVNSRGGNFSEQARKTSLLSWVHAQSVQFVDAYMDAPPGEGNNRERLEAAANQFNVTLSAGCFNTEIREERRQCLATDIILQLARHATDNPGEAVPGIGRIAQALRLIGPAEGPLIAMAVKLALVALPPLIDAMFQNYEYSIGLAKISGERVQLLHRSPPRQRGGRDKTVEVYAPATAWINESSPDESSPVANLTIPPTPGCAYSSGTNTTIDIPLRTTDEDAWVFTSPYANNWTVTLRDPASGRELRDIKVRAPNPANPVLRIQRRDVNLSTFTGASEIEVVPHAGWGFGEVQFENGSGYRLIMPQAVERRQIMFKPDLWAVGPNQGIWIRSRSNTCIGSVSFIDRDGGEFNGSVVQNPANPRNVFAVNFDLTSASRGQGKIVIQQLGLARDEIANVTVYAEVPSISQIEAHVGDSIARVAGVALDNVRSITIRNIEFSPKSMTSDRKTAVFLSSQPMPGPSSVEPETAQATFLGGFIAEARALIRGARPTVELAQDAVTVKAPAPTGATIAYDTTANVPHRSRLLLTFNSISGYNFSEDAVLQLRIKRDDSRENTPVLISRRSHLSGQAGAASMRVESWEDSQLTISFVPAEVFGADRAGKIQYRVVDGSLGEGDWMTWERPLVRLPNVTAVECPATGTALHRLRLTDLGLIQGISLTGTPESFSKQPCIDGSPNCLLLAALPRANRQTTVYFRLNGGSTYNMTLPVPTCSRR